jgi:hypothetical protein
MRRKPQTIEDIRAAVSAGTRQAAQVWHANSHLRGASHMARRMDERADQIDAGATLGSQDDRSIYTWPEDRP